MWHISGAFRNFFKRGARLSLLEKWGTSLAETKDIRLDIEGEENIVMG